MLNIGYRTLAICVAVATLLLSSSFATAQGFLVKPMQIEVGAPAGKISETAIELANTTSEPLRLAVRAIDLAQATDGTWQMIEPATSSTEPRASSALPWISLQTSVADIPAATTAQVGIRFNIPANARGTYIAGIIAEQPEDPQKTGLVVRVRFLIPVVITISGRTVRQDVSINDVAMVADSQTDLASMTTFGEVELLNSGRTFSKVRGELRLDAQVGNRWQTVTRVAYRERGIIPGAQVRFRVDLQRRLPSGNYRLRADFYVDGRRITPLEREIGYIGDPDADDIAFDTPLVLQPTIVEVNARPGAVRTTTITVENPSDEAVLVNIAAETPQALLGMVMGTERGEWRSAAPWMTVRPASFRLRGRGRQRVRIVAAVPDTGVEYANYYADLVLEGKYPDGQSAGQSRSTVQLKNSSIATTPDATIERLGLAEGESPSQYVVQVRLVNIGDVYLQPRLEYELLDGHGNVAASADLTGEAGALLPFGTRTFGGVIDLSKVTAGDYVLRVSAHLSNLVTVRSQIAVPVRVAGDAGWNVVGDEEVDLGGTGDVGSAQSLVDLDRRQ